MSEFLHQASLFSWSRLATVQRSYPGIELLFSTLNGVHLSKAQAGKAKASGMLAGVYDLILPVRRGEFVALAIEMKFAKGRLTPEQKWFGEKIREQGWKTETCWDWTEARLAIIDYLSLDNKKAKP